MPPPLPTTKAASALPPLTEACLFLSQVSERLRTLPATVPLLLQHILGTLEKEHGPNLLYQALATLGVTRSGQCLVWIGRQRAQRLDDLGWTGVFASSARRV